MRRLLLSLLLGAVALAALGGCGDDREKGANRDKDRPKAAP